MSVEQSGDEGSPAGTAASDATSAASDATSEAAAPAMDDLKRKFREALDRKRDKHAHSNAESAQGTGKVQEAHGPASSRRSFRRKSGG